MSKTQTDRQTDRKTDRQVKFSWTIGERDLPSNSKNAIARPLQRSSHLSSMNTVAGRLQLSVDSHKHSQTVTIGPFRLVIMCMCI